MATEENLWTLSAGDKRVASGKNRTATYMLSRMDGLAAECTGQPILIETDDDKVLKKGAEYAAQKGYDLVSADPAQNLKIIEAQKTLAGEDIAGGSLAPSDTLEKQQPAPSPELEKKQALEKLAQDRRDLDVEPKRAQPTHGVEVQPDADIAKIGEQMKSTPNPFHDNNVEAPEAPAAQRFPLKNPPEVIALTRHKYPAAKDHGDKLVITRMGMLAVTPTQKRDRADLVQAMLLKSRERFGEPVRITGNAPFEQEVIKAAIAQGIPLEMTSVHGEKAYAKALEAQQRQKPGLGVAGQMAQSIQKEAPAKGKGVGRELKIG